LLIQLCFTEASQSQSTAYISALTTVEDNLRDLYMIRFRESNADRIELNSQISHKDALIALKNEVLSACSKSVWYEIFTNDQSEDKYADVCMQKARLFFHSLNIIKKE